jgi:ferric-dicitrate binding protein FerR (iron transport regulator)
MFSDAATVPAEMMGKMRRWLVDPEKEAEKEAALEEKFMEIFRFNPEPVLAPQMWPDLARRLGMSEVPVMVATDPLAAMSGAVSIPTGAMMQAAAGMEILDAPKGGRTMTFRRIAARVAAVLIPAIVVAGAAIWLTNRGPENTLVQIAVPAGTTQTITLPDGSTIEAQGGTTIAYDEAAFSGERRVSFSGEALFDVASITGEGGAAAPFTVQSENLTVDVLGTVFRFVESSNTPGTAAVSLYEGSVEVGAGTGMSGLAAAGVEAAAAAATTETGAVAGDPAEARTTLAAGERLRVNTATGESERELIPASEMAQWGFMPLLRFDEAPLSDLVLALEMNYGVTVEVASGIDTAGGRYTADFEELSLGQVLEMLTKIDTNLSFRSESNGEMVTIRRK